MKNVHICVFIMIIMAFVAQAQKSEDKYVQKNDYNLPNVVPALDSEDDQRYMTYASRYVPVKDDPFIEHIRGKISSLEEQYALKLFTRNLDIPNIKYPQEILHEDITAITKYNGATWIGSSNGLYKWDSSTRLAKRHESYGVGGPLATNITALAIFISVL